MSAEVFEARYSCLQELRAHGHEELEDFLGRPFMLGKLVRTGLLRKEARCCDMARYAGYVPTDKAEPYLHHIPEHHLMMVPRGRGPDLRKELENDPCPDAVFHINFEMPLPSRHEQMRHVTGGDEASTRRAEALREWMLRGYTDLLPFKQAHNIQDRVLLGAGICRRPEPGKDDHSSQLVPTAAGDLYLHLVPGSDLLLVKPGMGLQLFELMDPTAASYWTSCLA